MTSARQSAASFPEGSINPNRRSYTETISPASSWADVPGVSTIQSGTLYEIYLRSS